MPTVTVEGNVTLQQAATALRDRLGSHYEVTPTEAAPSRP